MYYQEHLALYNIKVISQGHWWFLYSGLFSITYNLLHCYRQTTLRIKYAISPFCALFGSHSLNLGHPVSNFLKEPLIGPYFPTHLCHCIRGIHTNILLFDKNKYSNQSSRGLIFHYTQITSYKIFLENF